MTKKLLIILSFLIILPTFGCNAVKSARTIATYKSGDKVFTIDSDKEITGLDIEYASDNKGVVNFKLKEEKSGTSEALLQAAVKSQEITSKLLEKIVPILVEQATAIAAKGSGS